MQVVATQSTDVIVSVGSFKFDTIDHVRPVLDHVSIQESELGGRETGWIQKIAVRAAIPLLRHGLRGESKIMEIGGGVAILDERGEFLTDRCGIPPIFKDLERIPNYHVYMLAAYFAISLLHCRNVEVRDRPVSRQVRRMAERKGQPVIVYKELVIDAFRKQVRYETQGDGGNEIKRALHICRGHFATYGDHNPLFGKYTGTFWRPMHVRGHKEIGEVKKTYKVDSPR